MELVQEGEDLSNHTLVSTIKSRRPEKSQKKQVKFTQKFEWESWSTTHVHFLSSVLILHVGLKAFPKTFPTEISLAITEIKKQMGPEKQKKRGGGKAKGKS